MAADDHNPSRRALLGAAVGIPLIAGVGAEEAPPPHSVRSPSPAKAGEDWSITLAAFQAAEAELRGLEWATAGQSAEEEDALQEVYDDRVDAFGGAVRGVMLAAAPDLAAFAAKLELFFEHEVEPHSVDDEVMAAIRGDARRLAGFESTTAVGWRLEPVTAGAATDAPGFRSRPGSEWVRWPNDAVHGDSRRFVALCVDLHPILALFVFLYKSKAWRQWRGQGQVALRKLERRIARLAWRNHMFA
jgi:hypothetical protein